MDYWKIMSFNRFIHCKDGASIPMFDLQIFTHRYARVPLSIVYTKRARYISLKALLFFFLQNCSEFDDSATDEMLIEQNYVM